ncbi:MAG: hypothetical protein HYV99_00895 [Betaproteobacteria bacterium]|nr:hypothetical protein [Betaproteobacteria bacterium]MBI2508595.1 hypothetical protein [Betaproteobacteria bacterium]
MIAHSMPHAVKLTLVAVALAAAEAAGVAAAAEGLWGARAGLGFKPSRDAAPPSADPAFGGEAGHAWRAGRATDPVPYSGVRELPRLGLRSVESYSGIFHPLSATWGSSIETGFVRESSLAPRRYSLGGQLHTVFAGGRGLSVGLKYRVYDPDIGVRYGTVSESPSLNDAYGRTFGAAPGPSYQLQLSYRYSAAGTFGLALGREMETFTPYFDVPGNGPRQFTFTGQHWLTPSWSLSYDVLSNDPGNPFRLHGLRLGVGYRF